MTDKELLEWVQNLIANVENARAVGDHDMDEDKRKLEILKERLAQRR